MENEAMERVRKSNLNFETETLPNDDTINQLLARSRYFLYKNKSKWTPSQTQRTALFFELHPDIQKAYSLTQELRGIFENTKR